MTRKRRSRRPPAEQDVDMFGPPRLEDVSIDAMIVELERELALRGRVYPRMVQRGELEQAAADRQTLILEALLAKLVRERDDGYLNLARGRAG